MTLRRLPEPSKAKKPPTPVPAPCPGNSCIEMSYCNLRRLKELLGTGDEKAVPKDPGDGSHVSGASSWIPPAENWDAALPGLPYGWECAVDKEGKPYYINHLNKTTTYEDPRVEFAEEPPSPREVSLERQPDIGFGFVAGSEKPVIVRFVTENGPSDGKLLPGDQIWSVNSEDVKTAPRDHVIQLVRSCRDKVKLVVCQPPVDNSGRKSAILSAAKKARLRNRPPKVRFAEGVVINGAPLYSPSGAFSESEDLSVPFMPNVLKVFLENGQTKSFKYDSSTTVGDVLESLQAKLSIKAMENFALVVEHIKSLRRNKLTILDPQESLARIAARPGAQHLRCCFRVTYVPKDAYELLRNDSVAFEYLYTQCCNDVVNERFAPELKYEVALRLGALHIQQHALSHQFQSKVTVKAIEREFGLERFVPHSLLETMKRKELRKLLSHFLKQVQTLSAPGQKQLSALQAKLHYLSIIAQLPSYGAKCFPMNLKDGNLETVVLVSPRFGVSQISPMRNSMPSNLCDIESLSSVSTLREDELSHRVELSLKDPDRETIVLSLEDRDSEELILVLQGYYRLLTGRDLHVIRHRDRWAEDQAPPYQARHRVQVAPWSYGLAAVLPEKPKPQSCGETVRSGSSGGSGGSSGSDQDSIENGGGSLSSGSSNSICKPSLVPQQSQPVFRYVDLTLQPPYHQPPDGFVIPYGSIPGSPALSSLSSTSSRVKMEVIESNGGSSFKPQNMMDANMNKTYLSNGSCVDPNQNVIDSLKNGSVRQIPNGSLQRGIFNGVPQSHLFPHEYHESKAPPKLEDQEVNGVPPNGTSPKRALQSVRFGAEARNEEVIRRVAEMKKLVEAAEQYLTDPDDATDTEKDSGNSEASSCYGQLKHSDSLLLLSQGEVTPPVSAPESTVKTNGIRFIDQNGPSESDTDSLSTPTNSPMHQRPKMERPSSLKPSGSSFGLHSPDTFPSNKSSLHELIKRMSQASDNGVNTNSIYVDPDIIDLTMIPPPATPDDDGASKLPTGPSFPPTPFADRLSLDKELQALEDDLGDLKDLRIWNNSGLGGSTELGEGVSVASMAALAPLQYEDEEDIDSFIANVSVPPPPRSLESALMEPFSTVEHSPVVELTQDDINAFIIPPPPAGDSLELEKPIILRQKPKQPLTNGPVVKPPAPLPSEKESTGTLKLKVSAPPSEVSKQPPMSLPDRGPQASPKKRSPGRTLPTPPTEKPTLDLPTIAQRKELLLRAATNTNAEEEFPPPPTPQEDNAASRINGRELPKSPAKKIVQNPQPSHDQEDDRSPGPPIPPRSPIKGFNGPKTELRSPPSRLPPIPPEMKLVPKPPLPTKPKKAFGDQPPIEREKSSPRKLPPIPVAQNGFGKPPMPAPKPAINQALLKTVVNTSKEQAPQQPNGFHLSPVKPALKQNGLPPEPYLPNGISYECDSLETSFESESNSSEDAMQQLLGGRGRVTFAGTERHLQQVNKEMTDFSRSLTVVTPDDVQHEAYKELLTAEARQFVTASKLFVKSATETQDRLMDCLTQCVALMDRMADASKQMARHAPSVAQNDELLERVTDVGKTFLKTVQAAHRASGRNMNDPAMNTLMREATSLASALTALMKTLRVIPT